MSHRKFGHGFALIISGIVAALLITEIAYGFHFNLSSATSVHLFLITVIALRWGFLEASIVSMVSVRAPRAVSASVSARAACKWPAPM